MSAYALILWTIIAVDRVGTPTRDWREVVRFEANTQKAALVLCEEARANLNVKERSRCILVR